jgi:transposase
VPPAFTKWFAIRVGVPPGPGGAIQLRRAVSRRRPQIHEPFLRLSTFPGEQAQVDWAHFGHVMVGRARHTLSCFTTLSYSGALYLEFFFDQVTENFLRNHVHAFQACGETGANS